LELYDITIPISPSLAVWPGDTPFGLAWNMRLEAGDTVNLGSVTMSIHTGTHTDAPFHFLADGRRMEACDLARYLGPARVIDVSGAAEITVEHLRSIDLTGTPRVLLKTLAWTNYEAFPAEVPVIAAETPAYLQERGVVLLGVDLPSVDKIESRDLPNHRRLAACGIAIVESLDLRAVPPGVYELIALPLRLVGADGSPLRAVLRRP
jgi:arylformamidase